MKNREGGRGREGVRSKKLTVCPFTENPTLSLSISDFSPCIELTTRISWVTAPLELGGMTVLVGGSISNFKNFGTAA
jgi:hypothetical protein